MFICGAAVNSRDLHASLRGNERTRRVVPRLEPMLVIGVDFASGNEAQVDTCRPKATNIAHRSEHRRHDSSLSCAALGDVLKPRGKQGGIKRSRRVSVEPHTLTPRAVAACCRPQHTRTIAHCARLRGPRRRIRSSGHGRHGDGVVRQPVEVVDRSIDGIDHPRHVRCAVDIASFLTKDRVVRSK